MENVYYYHIMKCGGTTVSRMLDFNFRAERVMNNDYLRSSFMESSLFGCSEMQITEEVRRRNSELIKKKLLFRFELVYDHLLMARAASSKFYCFTILRNPIDRVLSQYYHLLRTEQSEKKEWSWLLHEMDDKLGKLSDVEFFLCLSNPRHDSISELLSNHCCIQAAIDYGLSADDLLDEDKIFACALEYYNAHFNFVGLAEQFDLSMRHVAFEIGAIPPAGEIRLNEGGRSPGVASAALNEAVRSANRADLRLYDYFRDRFDSTVARSRSYSLGEFEQSALPQRLAELEGRRDGEEVCFDLNGPFVGTGLLEREASGTANCMAWTGAEDLIVYLPAIAGREFEFCFDVTAYMHPSQRGAISVSVDDEVCDHTFKIAAGAFDRICVARRARRDFVKLRLNAPGLYRNAEVNLDPVDARRKGICVRGFTSKLAPEPYRLADGSWFPAPPDLGNRRPIFEGNEISIVASGDWNSQDLLVVQFCEADVDPDSMPEADLAHFNNAADYAWLQVIGKVDHWFRNGEWLHIESVIAGRCAKFRKVVLVGFASGAYGAILHARALGAARVVAAFPWVASDPGKPPHDHELAAKFRDYWPIADDLAAHAGDIANLQVVADLALPRHRSHARALAAMSRATVHNLGFGGAPENGDSAAGNAARRARREFVSALVLGDEAGCQDAKRRYKSARHELASIWIEAAEQNLAKGRAVLARRLKNRALAACRDAADFSLCLSLSEKLADSDGIRATADRIDLSGADAGVRAEIASRCCRLCGDAAGELAALLVMELHAPLSVALQTRIATLCLDEGHNRDAYIRLSATRSFAPEDPSTVFLMAECKARMGDMEAAIMLNKEAARLAPDDASILNSLVHRVNSSHRQAEAVELLRLALGRRPDAPELRATARALGFVQAE